METLDQGMLLSIDCGKFLALAFLSRPDIADGDRGASDMPRQSTANRWQAAGKTVGVDREFLFPFPLAKKAHKGNRAKRNRRDNLRAAWLSRHGDGAFYERFFGEFFPKLSRPTKPALATK